MPDRLWQPELDTILEDCLDAIYQHGWTIEDCLRHYAAHQDILEPILRTSYALSQSEAVRPTLRFKQQAAKRLQARIQTSSRPPIAKPSSSQYLQLIFNRLKILFTPLALLVFSAIFGTVGLLYAADSAIPGESLYWVDRQAENIQLSLSSDEQSAALRLMFAEERLLEAEALLSSGDSAYLDQTLDDYGDLITQADPTGDDENVQEATTAYTLRLEALLEDAPERSRRGIERAIDASSRGRDSNGRSPQSDEEDQGTEDESAEDEQSADTPDDANSDDTDSENDRQSP